jgi:hypothetical protein
MIFPEQDSNFMIIKCKGAFSMFGVANCAQASCAWRVDRWAQSQFDIQESFPRYACLSFRRFLPFDTQASMDGIRIFTCKELKQPGLTSNVICKTGPKNEWPWGFKPQMRCRRLAPPRGYGRFQMNVLGLNPSAN